MKTIRDTCIEFFKNEQFKNDFKDVMNPLVSIIYNEIYIYIWFICIYNVFLIFIVLAILFLLLHIYTRKNTYSIE